MGIIIPRNWLQTTLSTIRLQAYFYQALAPTSLSSFSVQKFTQLPGISSEDLVGEKSLVGHAKDYNDVVAALELRGDGRAENVKRTVKRWGRVEIADASFKGTYSILSLFPAPCALLMLLTVVGEQTVTPSSFVNMVVKLRITPPGTKASSPDVEEVKRNVKEIEERDEKFLVQRGEAEPLQPNEVNGYAHTPYWPETRKAGWWICLADDQKNRLVVPPIRVTDIPYSLDRKTYRAYKTQFQVPPNVGSYQWRLYVISDTYAGEEASQDLPVRSP